MTKATTKPNEHAQNIEPDGPKRVLVPIRDPSTPPSKRTLDQAKSLVTTDGELIIVHVCLYHNDDRTRWVDLYQSVSTYLEDIDASYIVRRGFSVEDAILEEAVGNNVDHIVVGKNAQPGWRQAIQRLFGSKPDIVADLSERASCTVDVVG